MKYHTILADPPWMEAGGGKIKRGADTHYDLLKTADIVGIMKKELDNKVEDNAHLYLWVTNNFLLDGLGIIQILGFRYITCITWVKDRIGLGQYFRGITEHCLFAVKGSLAYKTTEEGKRMQGVTGFFSDKEEHSHKPDLMYRMIEKVSYPPYLELFAREIRPGWDSWGKEVTDGQSQPNP